MGLPKQGFYSITGFTPVTEGRRRRSKGSRQVGKEVREEGSIGASFGGMDVVLYSRPVTS